VADIKAKGYADFSEEVPATEESTEPTWNTTSGKIELYSDALAKSGFSGIPVWEEPLQPSAEQFYLLTGKVAQYTQFGTQNNQLLHK